MLQFVVNKHWQLQYTQFPTSRTVCDLENSSSYCGASVKWLRVNEVVLLLKYDIPEYTEHQHTTSANYWHKINLITHGLNFAS